MIRRKIPGICLAIVMLALLVVPVMADIPEPTCWPPQEWYAEYCEWMAWQQQMQRDYTNETGYGLGALLMFSQWAEMREGNEPYWWKAATWQASSYLFCDSTGERWTVTQDWFISK